MSDWINEDMKDFRSENEREQAKRDLIAYSNFWAMLIHQFDKDIDAIRHLPEFAAVPGRTLKFIPFGEFYEIQMTTITPVFIKIANKGDSVIVRTMIDRLDGTEADTTETFKVNVRGGRVYLELNGKRLVIPEQASQYILQPILDMVKSETLK